MTPRLRSMVIDGDRTILVLDRCGPMEPDRARAMAADGQAAAERIGIAGAMVFPMEIDLGDDLSIAEFETRTTDGLWISAEEADAIRWLIGAARGLNGLTDQHEPAIARAENFLRRIPR